MQSVQQLDDQVSELQKQINEILGGEDNKINTIIQDLHVSIARISDKKTLCMSNLMKMKLI